MNSHAAEPFDPHSVKLWDDAHYEHDMMSTRMFGFWLYMLSDSLIFAGLFAAYEVLDHVTNAAGGPTAKNIVHPLSAYVDTVLLFTSVFCYSLAMVALKKHNRRGVLLGIGAAFILGLGFLGLEANEFYTLVVHGITPLRSGFLSAFFTLVIVHAMHMMFGLLWMLVMLVQVARSGFTARVVYRIANLKVFWLYQSLIWIFVYTFVYLRGAI